MGQGEGAKQLYRSQLFGGGGGQLYLQIYGQKQKHVHLTFMCERAPEKHIFRFQNTSAYAVLFY